jgi:hypothetical protein
MRASIWAWSNTGWLSDVGTDLIQRFQDMDSVVQAEFKSVTDQIRVCSKVKSRLGSHLLTPETRLYTQRTHKHPSVYSVGVWD